MAPGAAFTPGPIGESPIAAGGAVDVPLHRRGRDPGLDGRRDRRQRPPPPLWPVGGPGRPRILANGRGDRLRQRPPGARRHRPHLAVDRRTHIRPVRILQPDARIRPPPARSAAGDPPRGIPRRTQSKATAPAHIKSASCHRSPTRRRLGRLATGPVNLPRSSSSSCPPRLLPLSSPFPRDRSHRPPRRDRSRRPPPLGTGPAAPPVGTGPHGLRFVINGESAATLWGRVSDAGSRIYLPRAPAHSDPPPRIALRRTRTSPYPGVGCRADRLRQGLRNWADSHRRGFSAESDFRPPTTDLRLLREAAATKRSQSGLACRRSAAAFHVLRPSRSGMRRSSEAAA